MCGIAGIINKNTKVEHNRLKKMTDILAHRGPDGEGHWVEENIGLGHRRLSIIDLSDNASQPMHSLCGNYIIILNGEIYNYLEIKEKLLKKGYKFQSESDTEVLLNLYIEKGEKCFQELDGMFAFAIYNRRQEQLFCARDRFGEKPFYYYYEPGKTFIFASEMKAIFEAGIPAEIKSQMLYNFFYDKYLVSKQGKLNETFYNKIEQLKPSNYLTLNKNLRLKTVQYWDINIRENNNISFDEAVEQFRYLFNRSVKLRLRSDVPVGTSLSGGLDSSSIVSVINELNTVKEQKTFSARFKNYDKDEGYFIEKVVNATKVNSFYTWPNYQKLFSELDKALWHQEEPVGSANQFSQWEVMKLAKNNNVTVLLDGQGADEILTGYVYYFNLFFNELYRKDKTQFNSQVDYYKKTINPNYSFTEIHELKKSVLKSNIRYIYSQTLKKLKPYRYNRNAFLSEHIYNNLDDFQEEKYVKYPNSLNETLKIDAFISGKLQNLIRYGDKNSMAFSREVRLPFLSKDLVEFLFTLPPNFKINNGWSKYILRKSMEPILPSEITWRKDKIGYQTPQKDWFENKEIKNWMQIAIDYLKENGVINPKQSKTHTDKVNWQILNTYLLIKKFNAKIV